MDKKNFELQIEEASKLIYKRRFDLFKICLGDDVRVISEPKTGSTTIQYIINSPWHLHYTSPKAIKSLLHINKHNKNFVLATLVNVFFSFCLKIKAKVLKKEVKIISTIRNPADRVVSSFFFNLEYYLLRFRNKHPKSVTNNITDHELMIEYLLDEFVDAWAKVYEDFDYFDSQIKGLTGIDVYERDFNPQKGFNIYKKDKFSLMVIDCYKIKELGNEIEDFIGYEINTKIGNMNTANKKWYYQKYKNIYNESKKEEIINKLKESKYFNFFYNEN